jgi:hypothetical protein
MRQTYFCFRKKEKRYSTKGRIGGLVTTRITVSSDKVSDLRIAPRIKVVEFKIFPATEFFLNWVFPTRRIMIPL